MIGYSGGGGRIQTQKLKIGGMVCGGCQKIIKDALAGLDGVKSAEVSYKDGTAIVSYDDSVVSLRDITAVIEKQGYKASGGNKADSREIGLALIIFAVVLLLTRLGVTNFAAAFPAAVSGTSYGMLFIIGLITSPHCAVMCGGINLSQCINKAANVSAFRPSLLYNLGRVISYTLIGVIVGALGSVVTISGAFKGIIQLMAGVFMIIMGVNMLGIFKGLRRFNISMPKIFTPKAENKKNKENKNPFYIGLLNGLMPCGPLQAMQLYALSTGNPVAGGLSMLLFSLGTVPLMFGLGALSSMLSQKFTRKAMTVGAALVAALGVAMFSQGLTLSGAGTSNFSADKEERREQAADEVQIIKSSLKNGRYSAITVKKGIPVKWIIDAPSGSINGCNSSMIIPEYNIEHKFKQGENVIEFTPSRTGKFTYSCWMGMIRSTITVAER